MIILLAGLAPVLGGEERPVGLRELVVRAPDIVLAVPLDPLAPEQFRVVEVYRGQLKPGTVLKPDNVKDYQLRSFDPAVPPEREPRPRRIALALLFLTRSRSSKEGLELVPLGLRFCTDDARILVPRAPAADSETKVSPLEVLPDRNWSALLFHTHQDARTVEGLLARLRLRPEVRTAALFEWVRRHHHELGINVTAQQGWGPLEGQVFRTLLDAGTPEQAWQAVRLYAELNGGEMPVLPKPIFAKPEGRDLLARRALDDAALLGDRARALHLLANPGNLWPARGRDEAVPLSAREQETLLERLVPLLEVSGKTQASFRLAVTRALAALSRPDPASGLKPNRKVWEALVAAYRSETPGPTREELAEALCGLATPEEWKDLTGNPAGVLLCLRDLERTDDKLFFWLSLRAGSPPIVEQPTIVLERQGPLGVALETRRQPLVSVNRANPWKEGWTGADLLFVELPSKGLAPGTWRIRVRGTVGRDKLEWNSEPRRFVVEAPPKR